MRRRTLKALLVFLILLVPGLVPTFRAQSSRPMRSILVAIPKPYGPAVAAVRALGGQVLQEYQHFNGFFAIVPDDQLEAAQKVFGVGAVEKDERIPNPSAVDGIRARTLHAGNEGALATAPSSLLAGVDLQGFAGAQANSINNAGTRIDQLHAIGLTGAGRIVAVVDSGIRMNYKFVLNSVIGGVDFVDDGTLGPADDTDDDWKKNSNDGHGTFVAGLIAGNSVFAIDGVLRDAFDRYSPSSLADGKLPLIGTAPRSRLYVVRVFGDPGTGALKSTILAAIEHLIDQRLLSERTGGRQGVHIDVANLSLGVGTLHAGRDILDQAVDALLQAGIVPVVSVGNAGPSTLTIADPGSSWSALTIGGTSRAANDRILNEVFWGTEFPLDYYPGIGGDLRPYSGTEIAWFSSRGPNADGRLDPDVVASGVGNIGQGYCPSQPTDACYNRISIASGTSFAAPIVSGIAAVLMQGFPNATATQIRNAIIQSGRVNQVESYFDVHDKGRGLPDALGAFQLLGSGKVSSVLPVVNQPDSLVRRNIELNTSLTVSSGFFSKRLTALRPGQRGEILYEVPRGTERVLLSIKNIRTRGVQNPFYGSDTVFLYVHSSKTSAVGEVGDYLVSGTPFFGGDPEHKFSFLNPEPGIMRIVLNPDTFNAGLVDADVTVEAIPAGIPLPILEDVIDDGKTKKYSVNIPSGTGEASFLLTWDHDWAHYPTSDLDMFVCSPSIPDGIPLCIALGDRSGAGISVPERATITSPEPGKWNVVVRGFNVPTGTDAFQLAVTTAP